MLKIAICFTLIQLIKSDSEENNDYAINIGEVHDVKVVDRGGGKINIGKFSGHVEVDTDDKVVLYDRDREYPEHGRMRAYPEYGRKRAYPEYGRKVGEYPEYRRNVRDYPTWLRGRASDTGDYAVGAGNIINGFIYDHGGHVFADRADNLLGISVGGPNYFSKFGF